MVEIQNNTDELTLRFCKVCLPVGRKAWLWFTRTTWTQCLEEKANCVSKFSLSVWTFILDHARCALSHKLSEQLCCESKLFHRAMIMERSKGQWQNKFKKTPDLIALCCEYKNYEQKEKEDNCKQKMIDWKKHHLKIAVSKTTANTWKNSKAVAYLARIQFHF